MNDERERKRERGLHDIIKGPNDIYPSPYLSIYLSICPSVRPSVYLFVSLFVYLFDSFFLSFFLSFLVSLIRYRTILLFHFHFFGYY